LRGSGFILSTGFNHERETAGRERREGVRGGDPLEDLARIQATLIDQGWEVLETLVGHEDCPHDSDDDDEEDPWVRRVECSLRRAAGG
jgi:hypothetical protein